MVKITKIENYEKNFATSEVILLSIIVPCFNEINTIGKVIEKIKESPIQEKEIIIIDDFSSDGSREYLQNLIINNKADIVYGSRFKGGQPHRVVYFWHRIGNGFLTLLSNIFTDLNLSDMETCYKAFKSEVIKNITIEEERFGFEPEITAKVSKKNYRIFEVGISYYGRTYKEGKKIGGRDGIHAIWCILKYNLFR